MHCEAIEYCPTTGKRSYRHQADAKRAAREVSARGKGGSVNAYECRFCGLFHLGREDAKGRSFKRWRKIARRWQGRETVLEARI